MANSVVSCRSCFWDDEDNGGTMNCPICGSSDLHRIAADSDWNDPTPDYGEDREVDDD